MEHEVRIPILSDDVNLSGLYIPELQGLVLFYMVPDRFSPETGLLLSILIMVLATLLFDLLT